MTNYHYISTPNFYYIGEQWTSRLVKVFTEIDSAKKTLARQDLITHLTNQPREKDNDQDSNSH